MNIVELNLTEIAAVFGSKTKRKKDPKKSRKIKRCKHRAVSKNVISIYDKRAFFTDVIVFGTGFSIGYLALAIIMPLVESHHPPI